MSARLFSCRLLMFLILATSLSLAAPVVSYAGGALDGKVFTAVIDGENDLLTFDNGTFNSSACDAWGFGTGAYTTTAEMDGTMFEATVFSDKNGKMVWTGIVKGDEITGSYVWTKEGWFSTKTKTEKFSGSLNP